MKTETFSKIMVLAEPAFGKTSSLMNIPEYGIKGLDPKETYIISVTSKPLPGRGSGNKFPLIPDFTLNTKGEDLVNYRRIHVDKGPVNNPKLAVHALNLLKSSKSIKTIVLDDFNYYMQDYYMSKAISQGWETPKQIGYNMGKIFEVIETITNKNIILLAHYEEYNKVDGRLGARLKTTGRMTQEYVTPEGKFDIVLFGKTEIEEDITGKKNIKKVFVTGDDGIYSMARNGGPGMFELYEPNDMSIILEKVHNYYNYEENKSV